MGEQGKNRIYNFMVGIGTGIATVLLAFFLNVGNSNARITQEKLDRKADIPYVNREIKRVENKIDADVANNRESLRREIDAMNKGLENVNKKLDILLDHNK